MKKASKQEADELERDIHQQMEKRSIRRAVNPQRGFGC